MPHLERDSPRTLPWHLPDYRNAQFHYEVLDDGRLHIEIEHLFLSGIQPNMLAWFYQQLPISTVDLNGTTYPLYHLFHPTEHGRIKLMEPATNGQTGMHVGALVAREEWFGSFNSKGAGRVIEFSANGMLIKPEIAGMHVGQIHHEFIAEAGGTRYKVHSIIGSDWPVVGSLINFYIRSKLFPPAMLEQWLRHQVEEVSSLQFFLPVLYQSQAVDNHYKIQL
ncbi:hypothetical protein KIH87_06750 [Paraneptunicella aestuarii]|uniref:hypothetical protein n=1 Tax=Paraneptunicella aestuarii TaxID=2831148 RepID=UPI001E5073C8|nr:hypothetical protein [Paraneptunicella aestuarii]UAA40043.1 hypothetical protein KIH87_06750 [Paraneptunicella aestuarii]